MNCDRIAPWYRWLEFAAFANSLQRRRVALLPAALEGTAASSVLILGEGDGRFLIELVRQQPHIRVDVVEASARMIELARNRLVRSAGREAAARVKFHCAEALAWLSRGTESSESGEPTYDLIVTNFFLDCFDSDQLPLIIAAAAARLSPRSRWLISEFRRPPKGLAAWRAAILLCVMYSFFRLMTGLRVSHLADHRPFLGRNQFHLLRARLSQGGFLVSELWERR